MARTIPSDRVERLLGAAAAAFVAHGFERAQMDDVAERLGVSKGTVYRAVESKDALFVGVLDFADDPAAAPSGELLVDADILAAAKRLRVRLGDRVAETELLRAPPTVTGADVASQVHAITRELFDVMTSCRVAVMVLDRCAPEMPEVAEQWFGSARYALVDGWATYLAPHADAITPDVPIEMLARSITELVTTWAVKMPWDPAPRQLSADPGDACAAMVRNLVVGGPR